MNGHASGLKRPGTGIPKPGFKRQKQNPSNENKPSKPVRAISKPLPLKPQASRPSAARPAKSQTMPQTMPQTATTRPRKPATSTIKSFRTNPTLTLKEQLQCTKDKLSDLTTEHADLRASLEQLESDLGAKTALSDQLSASLRVANQQLAKLKSDLDLAESELKPLRLSQQVLMNKCSQLTERIADKTTQLDQVTEAKEDLEKKRNKLRSMLKTATDDNEMLKQDLAEMTISRNTHKQGEADLLQQLNASEKTRRYLHNMVMELKGNIRVFCRVRPLLSAEKQQEKQPYLDYPETEQDKSIIYKEPETSHDGQFRYKEHFFTYDKVFGPEASQSHVFAEVEQLVQSALDGYNVCIFAYGVTSSGKTFTMQGPEHVDASTRGMIPRSIDLIFETIPLLKSKGWSFELKIMYVEIYNEALKDLIAGFGGAQIPKEKPDVRILKTSTETLNCNAVVANDKETVWKLIAAAEKARSVGATNCNERSSRSHSVFTLLVNGRNETSGEQISGSLNLVDLAGSERLQSSQSTGQRLKETQSINKSLSALGDVIAALAKKDKHVPYRNSKLTSLLKNALGGNAKTLMLVNVSPYYALGSETLNSLRFAKKTNACDVGSARRVAKNDLKSDL